MWKSHSNSTKFSGIDFYVHWILHGLWILTYWERTCAMAAPLTPKWQTKIRIGSSITFIKSPATKWDKTRIKRVRWKLYDFQIKLQVEFHFFNKWKLFYKVKLVCFENSSALKTRLLSCKNKVSRINNFIYIMLVLQTISTRTPNNVNWFIVKANERKRWFWIP